MVGKSLTIILGIGVALILALMTSFSSGELVPQERLIETINIGSLPAYSTGSINGWTCPEKSSDGTQVDRCAISNGFSLNPKEKWQGYCIAEQSSLAMSLGCSLAGGETMYGNTGYAFGCCAQGKTYTDSQGNIGCSQAVTPVSCNGIRNIETSFSATLYEKLIQCPDGSYNYRSLCMQAQNTPSSIFVSTNLAGATFSLTGASYYSGSGTSWSKTNAPAGTYTITYGTVTGYNAPPSETKTLIADGSITFSGTYNTITPATGSISVSSTPTGASVYLDGSYQSTTPCIINNVPAGSHTIILKLTGYQDWSTTVSVVAWQTNTISAPLTQPGATAISVSSTPSGATIYLDGDYKKETPYTITNVAPGSHLVELKLSGYKDWKDTIDVKVGSTSYVSVPLASLSTATATTTPTYTALPTPTPPNLSVSLHGEKTDVVLGEDILLKLSAVNLITKPKMHVQVIIIPPSGMSVTSSEFSKSGAGQFTSNYELEPGDGRDIEVRIKSNQVGDFNVNGRIVYYFGDEKDKGEDYMLDLPVKVRNEPVDSAQNPIVNPAKKSIPGFGIVISVIGLLLTTLLKRKR